MSTPLKLYYDLMSQPARALYMFLKLNQIPHQGYKIDIARGEHLTANYESINPFKRIPCIVHGDFKLSESIAIYRYLASEYQIVEHWYPRDVKKRARVDEYLEWQHMNTRLAFSTYFWRTWLIPKLFGKTVPKAKISEAKKQMETTLDLLTDVWLKDSQFIAGDEITVADLVAATEIEQLGPTGYDAFEGRPKLMKWIQLVRNKTNPLYDEAHKLIHQVATVNKAKL